MLLILFTIGAGMGSVANALIDRLPRGESWVKGRSHCDKCGHVLGILDLIPLLSYLVLSAKYKGCRYCHKPIPVRNFLVELILGLAFMVILGHTWAYDSFVLIGIFFITIVIAVMDWETRLVSETLVGLWLVLVVLGGWGDWVGALVGLGVIGGIWAVTRGKAMGFGDVEIATVMGWWLGWPRIVPALWVAFVSGAIIGIWQLAVGKLKMKSEIAFGPFLVFGAWVAYFVGDIMIKYVFPNF